MQQDGTSKTAMITESREQEFASWYAGTNAYVVGVWPEREGPLVSLPLRGNSAGKTRFWSFRNQSGNALALNQGSNRATEAGQYYCETTWPHGNSGSGGRRRWGPSSLHSGGIVLHGFGDGHVKGVKAEVDSDVYMYVITRQGRETYNEDEL